MKSLRGFGEIGPFLFERLGIVRVYTKTPGKPPDHERSFTLRRVRKIEDVARRIHKDIAHAIKYARVWSKSGFDGQHVGGDHPLAAGDIIELHV